MASKWRRWAIGFVGWLVPPTLAWGAVTAVVAVIWAALAGLPAVFVAIAFVAALAVGMAVTHNILVLRDRLRTRKPQASGVKVPAAQGSIPAPAYNYGHEADKALQSIQAMFDEARRRKFRLIEAELVALIDEGERLRGNEFSGNPSLAEFDAWRSPVIEFIEKVFGKTEKQRLLEVKWNGFEVRDYIAGVLDWLRALRDRPDSWRVPIGGEELEAAIEQLRSGQGRDPASRDASSLKPTEGRERHDNPLRPPPEPSLVGQLDSLMREGMDLLAELSVPVEPKVSNGVVSISGGEAPDGWWDKANDFQQGIRKLLTARHPALLTVYRDGFNGHFQKKQEVQETSENDPLLDRRPDLEKFRDFATFQRGGPSRIVEGCLEGLAAVRHRLDEAQPAQASI